MKLNKLLLVFFLLLGVLMAEDRPKVALVLSGGGARGGAHVGVLKILEKNNIPVDIVVGTSMGAFVGGLYASGKTPQEIEKMLITTNWKKHIIAEFYRPDIPMRKKEIEYLYQGKLRVGINADNEFVLPTGLLKSQPLLYKYLKETAHVRDIKDFDKLPIPYRAVATNIKNGDAVVLKSGLLGNAIYASTCIPGGLQPIEIDGLELVDGGISNNFPIAVAKDMGADVIIAIDVGSNFDADLDVDSYLVIMGQLIDILTRRNANRSIAELNDKDILLTPDLDGFSSLDASKYKEIIQRGVDVAVKREDSLKKLSLSDEDYAEYKKNHRYKVDFTLPVIDRIEIDNPTYLSDDSIHDRLHKYIGKEFDEKQIQADLIHIYNMKIFDHLDYELKNENGENILLITTAPSWDNHGEVRFSIGLEDDFNGHSSYSFKLGYTMFGLTSYGGEWKNDFEIGRKQRAYTELFLPLDSMQRYYIRPSLEYESITDLVPIEYYDDTLSGNIEMVTKRAGGSFAMGMHVTTDYEFEIGASMYQDNEFMELADSDVDYDARPIYASFKSDSLDNIHFPKHGFKSQLKWTKEMTEWDSSYEFEQVYLDFELPFTFMSNNITAYFKCGTTYNIGKDADGDDKTALRGSYTLGGLFNLSGYEPYSLNNDNMVFGALRYRYQIRDSGFFGVLDTPLYVGFSAESGDTWSEGIDFESSDLKYAGSIYFAADTFLGPFYLAYGYTSSGEQSGYLYLGEKF